MRLFMQEWHWAVVVHVVHSSEYLAAAYSCPATPTGSAVYTEQVDCAAVDTPPPPSPPFRCSHVISVFDLQFWKL